MKSLSRALPRAVLPWLVAVGLSFSLGALPACSKTETGPDAGAPFELTPIPAPAGLLATASMPKPDATWARARAAVGGPAAFFPQSFGGLAATALGLPITAAGEIDGDVPALAAFGTPEGGKTPMVAALHVKVGDRFGDQLTKGDASRFTSKIDSATHVAVFAPKGAAGKTQFVLGLLGNYLLVATNEADLLALGPYVVRTLPSAAQPKEDIAIEASDAALAGPALERATSFWKTLRQRAEASGAPIVMAGNVDSMLNVFGDLAHARVALTLDTGIVHARAELTPKPGNGPASQVATSMAVGDAKAILDLPASAQIAGILRSANPAARAEAAPSQADALGSALGKPLQPEEKEQVVAALREEIEASGDWLAFGFALAPTGPAGYARAPVTDEAKMQKAVTDLVALTKLPTFKARVAELEIGVSTGKTKIENLPGDVGRVRFEKKGAPGDKAAGAAAKADDAAKPATKKAGSAPGEPPSRIDVLYLVQQAMLVGSVGEDAKLALHEAVDAPTGKNLGADPAVKTAVEALGADVAFALFVDATRLIAARSGRPAPPSSAPILLSFGKHGAPPLLVGGLDMSNAAIVDILKNRGGF